MSTTIQTIKCDITKIQTDAIVNAANTSLLGGGGVDGSIHAAAGYGLYQECVKLNGCNTGEAKITGAYNLPCKYVIHTVGPVWYGGTENEDQLLQNCYENSLILAEQNHIRTIAFPSISTGIYGFPVERASKIAVMTVKEYVEKHPDSFEKIYFAFIGDDAKWFYDNALETIS